LQPVSVAKNRGFKAHELNGIKALVIANEQQLYWRRGMRTSLSADERVADVRFSKDRLIVTLQDDRTISVPLAWYPRLQRATPKQRRNWQVAGGGYGIHWPDLDEDLNTEGLLRGAPSPEVAQKPTTPAGERLHANHRRHRAKK
jgi:hypothetical protein